MTPSELMAAFEALAEAPEGAARLRELVLQLAVRGRLVQQNPEDEPASVLLSRIATQKASLLGSARTPLVDDCSPTTADGTHGHLPKGWQLTRLADLALTTDAGWSPKCEGHPTATLREWGVLKTTAVQQNCYMEEHHKALPHALQPRPDLEVSEGDVLVTRAGPWFRVGVAAHVAKTRPRLMLSDKIIRCRMVPNGANGVWVALCINSGPGARWLREQQSGMDSAQMNISQDRLRSMAIPVPPLAEQHRIVARVEELMGLLDRLEAARTKREAIRAAARDSVLAALRAADSPEAVDAAWTRFAQRMEDLLCNPADIAPLRQAVLQLAVRGRLVRQDPKDEPVAGLAQNVVARRRTSRGQSADSSVEPLFSVPSNWRWLRMDAVTDLASGVTKGRSLVGRKTTALPYLRVANVQAGFLDLKVIKTIDVPNDEIDEGLLLRGGDVLLTEGGDWDKLGRSAIWNGEVAPCTHQNHVFRARPLGAMDPRWISMFTNSPDGRSYFQSCAKRTTNLASINMTQLRACPVPVPPVAEQRRIVARVQELMGWLDGLEQRFAAQKAAHAAFAGAAVHHVVA